VQVQDAVGQTNAVAFTMTVTDANSSGPSITTTSLPGTSYGATVNDPVLASDGVAPYTWSATGLPNGLSIDPSTGTISGIPTVLPNQLASGTTTFTPTIQVQDAVGQIATTTLSIDVHGKLRYSWVSIVKIREGEAAARECEVVVILRHSLAKGQSLPPKCPQTIAIHWRF